MLWFINSFAGFASAIARWCCGHLYKRSLLKKLVANHFLIQFPCIFLKQLKRTWNQRIGRFCSVDTTFNWVCCPWCFPRYFFGWTGASCELLPSYLWIQTFFLAGMTGNPQFPVRRFASAATVNQNLRGICMFSCSVSSGHFLHFFLCFFSFLLASLWNRSKKTQRTHRAQLNHI